MTLATVTTRLNVNDPIKEVVVLTASATNTYISKKFGAVTAAQATLMEDTGALSIPVSVAISGATVTLYCSGASTILSSKKVCLTLYGKS